MKDKMKRALVTATVFGFLNFEKSDIEILQSMGYEVHTATNMYEANWLQDNGTYDNNPIVRHQIDFGRSPFSLDNIKAYRQLKLLLRENHFDIIHCHTPVAAVITRLAAKKTRKKGTYVIYTCHGFHFHKTSAKKDWIMYYPIEKFLSHYTDMIITINKEDYGVIQGFKVKEKKYIPGVGIDSEHIHNLNAERTEILEEFGIPADAFVILVIGELSERKNQAVILKAIQKTGDDSIYCIFCGTGYKEKEYKDMAADLGISNRVIFAGHRSHESVMQICHAVDIGAIPSRIEGLGLAGIEILAAGKPLVGANIQGINDYLIPDETGYSFAPDDSDGFAKGIIKLKNDKSAYENCSGNAYATAQKFDIKTVRELMKEIYAAADNIIFKK